MLKGCQNSLAVQEHTQEIANQMLQIKTPQQSQLRTAFKRRIKISYTPFVSTTCRVAASQGEGHQNPSTWKMLPSSQTAHVALWEGCESSEMETTCEHTPLGRAPCARQRADHQLTACVKYSGGVWLVWEPHRRGGREVPTLCKEPGTWLVCVCWEGRIPLQRMCWRSCLTRQSGFSLLSVRQFISSDSEINLQWYSVNWKIARGSHFALFLA